MKPANSGQIARATPTDQTTTKWEYLGLSASDGLTQMETDRHLLADIQSGVRARPILRFYSWNPPAVSFGHNQKASDSISLDVAKGLGYDIVQRPTGGRALLHKGDLCYAVVGRREHHSEFRTLTQTYRAISRAHRLMLERLGVALSASPDSGSRPANNLSPCFAMVNPFEVTVRGRKICGSAQFRAGDSFLQHGSLRIYDSWTQSDLSQLWPTGLELAAESVTSMEVEAGKRFGMEKIGAAWSCAFSETFEIGLESGSRA